MTKPLTKEFIEKSFPRVKIRRKDVRVLKELNNTIRAYEDNWKMILAVCEKIDHCNESEKQAFIEEHKRYVAVERILNRKDINLRKELGIYLEDPCRDKNCHTENPNCIYPEVVIRYGRRSLWCRKYNIPAAEIVGRIKLSKEEWTELEIFLAKQKRKREREWGDIYGRAER